MPRARPAQTSFLFVIAIRPRKTFPPPQNKNPQPYGRSTLVIQRLIVLKSRFPRGSSRRTSGKNPLRCVISAGSGAQAARLDWTPPHRADSMAKCFHGHAETLQKRSLPPVPAEVAVPAGTASSALPCPSLVAGTISSNWHPATVPGSNALTAGVRAAVHLFSARKQPLSCLTRPSLGALTPATTHGRHYIQRAGLGAHKCRAGQLL